MNRTTLLGQTPDQWIHVVNTLGLPPFTVRQLGEWIYKRGVGDFEAMSNLSRKAREQLAATTSTGLMAPCDRQVSTDGTRKYLFPVENSGEVEAVYIPDKERATLCVSSQVGCRWRCAFCRTGQQGFEKHCSAADILNQVLSLPERDRLTNLVFMGMGEPFDNTDAVMQSLAILTAPWGLAWSPRRITVSTVGVLPGVKRFMQESQCHLAVSLHTPFPEERRQWMPVEAQYPIAELLDYLASCKLDRQRRLSFEIILFNGLNDTPRHVNGIVRALSRLRCRVNLIRFHAHPGSPFQGSSEAALERFRMALVQKGIRTTVRASRGQDILAACGMLSTKSVLQTPSPFSSTSTS